MAVFTNQATLSFTGGSVQSNVTRGEILEPVTLTKTAVSAGYEPGGTVSYAVSLRNSGPTAITGLTLRDDLGAYEFDGQTVYPLAYNGSLLFFVDGVLQADPTVTAGPPLTVTGITLPAGANAMLIYETRVTDFAPLCAGAEITNTVTLTGCRFTPLTASATVPLRDTQELSITKSLSPEVVTAGGEITYTFVMENTGPEPETTAVLTDDFDPILHDLSVTLNGASFPASSYTYNEATGLFTTLAGRLTIPAATYSRNSNGCWVTTPGMAVLTVTGTL